MLSDEAIGKGRSQSRLSQSGIHSYSPPPGASPRSVGSCNSSQTKTTSSENQNLTLTGTSVGTSPIWVGKGDGGKTPARRAACTRHSELNWRTTLPLPLHRLFFSQRCLLSTQHCAISTKEAIPVHCKEHSCAHHSLSLSYLRNGSGLIASRDLRADTELRTPF